MTATKKIANADITINSTAGKVWEALTNPEKIKKYMFGANVASDWKEGGDITWKGEWQGKSYEDKGKILSFIPNHQLQYTHFSPLSGLEDKPENYHTVTIDLVEKNNRTHISLSQDNNESGEAKKHSEKNWNMMLTSLKKLIEETT